MKIYSNFLVFFKVLSSPKLKAQVSFSDRLLSVVCLSVRLSDGCKLFIFSTSSPEPLGQFQSNKFVQVKGHAPLQVEIIPK